MKRMLCAFLLALLAPYLSSAASLEMQVTPVQKVLQMMSEMKSKGEKMMDQEQKTMAKYDEWVDDTATELKQNIEWAEREIEELLAFIEKADNKVARLGESIEQFQGEVEALEKQKADAIAVRKKQHAEYEKVSTDFEESVSALERAIETLKKQNYDRSTAELFLQRIAKAQPGMRRVLAAFLQEKKGEAQAAQDGAPSVAAYEFQSGGIIEMLEGLYDKFKTQLDDTQKDEVNEQHYFELEVQHLTDTIDKTNSEIDEMSSEKAETEAASAKAKGKLASTRKGLAEDKAFLQDVIATHESKSATFAANQKVRADEIAAISKAIEIISSPDVAGGYKDNIKLAQVSASKGAKVASFMQMHLSRSRRAQEKAVAFLQMQAKRLSSKTLEAFSVELAANPFEKVIGMIEDLVAKLKEEAAAEAEHKAWCDEQLKENKLKRNKQTSEVNKLTAAVEELTSDIETMTEEIATLIKEQKELTVAMKKATEQRQEEKAENMEAIADGKAGAAAVGNAISILKEFYSSQDSFLQHHQVPEMEAYKGMQSSKGGIVGMLEVIQTDFMRLEAETKASEEEAVRVYDTFMVDSKTAKKMKHKEEVQLKLDKDAAEFKKSETMKDLKWNEEELAKAKEYFEVLKPQCLQVHVSYEERVAKRKQEIEALKEAYEILDSKQ